MVTTAISDLSEKKPTDITCALRLPAATPLDRLLATGRCWITFGCVLCYCLRATSYSAPVFSLKIRDCGGQVGLASSGRRVSVTVCVSPCHVAAATGIVRGCGLAGGKEGDAAVSRRLPAEIQRRLHVAFPCHSVRVPVRTYGKVNPSECGVRPRSPRGCTRTERSGTSSP